jgi:hypothetical protein
VRQYRTPPRCWYRDVEGCEEIIGGHGLVLKLTNGTGFRQLPTGLGECQLSRGGCSTAAAVKSSSGMSCLINPLLFAFRKAVAVLLSPCLWLSRPAVLPSLCPHCPPSNATDPPLWLLHQAIRTDGLRHLLVCLSPSLSHCMCHVPFACL